MHPGMTQEYQTPELSHRQSSMAPSLPTVGFIGLGPMGCSMALNLVRKGYEVHGFDSHASSLNNLAAAGGLAASSPHNAASQAEIVISMLVDTSQTEAALFDGADAAVHGLKQGAAVMLCSSCPPDYALVLQTRFKQANREDIMMIDCPVSGSIQQAADGTLSIFASGNVDHLDDVAGVLSALSANLYWMTDISNGSHARCIHQLLEATNIITAAEAIGLAATVGLNTRATYEHVNSSDGASFSFEDRVPHMLANDWRSHPALDSILQDVSIVTATARKQMFPTPLASTAEQEYLRGVQHGFLCRHDAKVVQMYLPASKQDRVAAKAEADVKMVKSHQISKEMIADMLAGVHLAASIECMAFCKMLGFDRKLMFDIVSKEAGRSSVFVKHMPALLERDEWDLQHCAAAQEIGQKLATVVEKCRLISYPCPMAQQALCQYYFAGLKVK